MPRQLEGDQEIVDVEADVDGLRRGHNITLSLGQNGNLTNPLLVHRSHSSLRIYTVLLSPVLILSRLLYAGEGVHEAQAI